MELFRALAVLAEPPRAETAHLAVALELGAVPEASEYTDLFVFQLYPYASVYLGAEGMLGGEARDRIAGFWRALGQVPPAEPDHLAVMNASSSLKRSWPRTLMESLIGWRERLPPGLSVTECTGRRSEK